MITDTVIFSIIKKHPSSTKNPLLQYYFKSETSLKVDKYTLFSTTLIRYNRVKRCLTFVIERKALNKSEHSNGHKCMFKKIFQRFHSFGSYLSGLKTLKVSDMFAISCYKINKINLILAYLYINLSLYSS